MLDEYPAGVYVSSIPPRGTRREEQHGGPCTAITIMPSTARTSSSRQHGVKDPVCGMTVDPHTAKHRARARRPALLLLLRPDAGRSSWPIRRSISSRQPAPPSPCRPGTIYTCPMHPEIRQVGPGSCPICGMALEPEMVTADAGPNPELADMTRRLLDRPGADGAGVRAGDGRAPVRPARAGSASRRRTGCSSLLATPVVLWAGWPFFERGWASLKTRNLNMFTLIAMGTGVAWIYSVVGTLLPGLFPAAMRGHDGSVAVYFEAAAVITVLVLLGQVLELRGARADQRRHPRAARPVAEDGAPHQARRHRRGRGARPGRGRRPPARAAGRARAGRRRDRRGPQRHRRIDGDGRVDAGDQGRRRQGDRRHHEPVGRLRDARRQGRPRHACSRGSCRWWRRRSAAARRSSGWRIRCRAGSCRR